MDDFWTEHIEIIEGMRRANWMKAKIAHDPKTLLARFALDADEQFNSTRPFHNWMGDTIFQVKPEESGGTARIAFYRLGTTMVNDTDELPNYMRGYTDGFVEYNFILDFNTAFDVNECSVKNFYNALLF